jgi:hypothetical protein
MTEKNASRRAWIVVRILLYMQKGPTFYARFPVGMSMDFVLVDVKMMLLALRLVYI